MLFVFASVCLFLCDASVQVCGACFDGGPPIKQLLTNGLHCLLRVVRWDAVCQVVIAKIDDTARRLRADPNEDVPPNLDIIRKALYKSRHEMSKAGSKKSRCCEQQLESVGCS